MPSQDVVLGIYYITREKIGAKGEGMLFSDVAEVHRAYEGRRVELQAKVQRAHRASTRWSVASRVHGRPARWTPRSVARCCRRSCHDGLSFDVVNAGHDQEGHLRA